MPPSIIRLNARKAPRFIAMTLVSLGVPAVVYGGMLLGYWSDPLVFLEGILIGDAFSDKGSFYTQKVYILFLASTILYTIFIGSRQIQHVSFLGKAVVIKLLATEKRYPIAHIKEHRIEKGMLHLDFGYDSIRIPANEYQKSKIEKFINREEADPQQLSNSLRAAVEQNNAVWAGNPQQPAHSTQATTAEEGPTTKTKRSVPKPVSVSKSDVSPEKILSEISKNDSKPASINSLVILIISVVAFASLGILSWSIEFIAFLLVSIFIHECGHLLAMRLFKYTNLKMLFLPFLGGVAIGESKEQDATKIALITLAGPVFGLLSAIVFLICWIPTQYDPLLRLALFSVILNGFNLIPFKPLDGGHFLNEALFSRYPKAEAVFSMLAIAGLGYFALKLQSFILAVPALFILLTISRNYNIAKIGKRLSQNKDFQDRELDNRKVATILGEIQRYIPQLFVQPNNKIIAITVSNIWRTAYKKHPKPLTSVAFIFLYIALTLFVVPFSYGFIQGFIDGAK